MSSNSIENLLLHLLDIFGSYDRGDYDSFAREITNTDWNNLKDDDIDTYANNVTNCIIGQATKHIPNKSVKIRQSDPPRLTNTIRKLMTLF